MCVYQYVSSFIKAILKRASKQYDIKLHCELKIKIMEFKEMCEMHVTTANSFSTQHSRRDPRLNFSGCNV